MTKHDIQKYIVVATNKQGCVANARGTTWSGAMRAFDAVWSRKGFIIDVYGIDANDNQRLVIPIKSTYR